VPSGEIAKLIGLGSHSATARDVSPANRRSLKLLNRHPGLANIPQSLTRIPLQTPPNQLHNRPRGLQSRKINRSPRHIRPRVSISQSTTPKLQISLRLCTTFPAVRFPARNRSQPKVKHLYDALRRNHNIRRLQIPMRNSFFMRGLLSLGNLLRIIQGSLQRLRNRERRTRHQLHHQRANAAAFFQPINLSDVGMIQRSQHIRLPLKPRQAERRSRKVPTGFQKSTA
jgi:hypothetical protein